MLYAFPLAVFKKDGMRVYLKEPCLIPKTPESLKQQS
jgi:hypothetical protein